MRVVKKFERNILRDRCQTKLKSIIVLYSILKYIITIGVQIGFSVYSRTVGPVLCSARKYKVSSIDMSWRPPRYIFPGMQVSFLEKPRVVIFGKVFDSCTISA